MTTNPNQQEPSQPQQRRRNFAKKSTGAWQYNPRRHGNPLNVPNFAKVALVAGNNQTEPSTPRRNGTETADIVEIAIPAVPANNQHHQTRPPTARRNVIETAEIVETATPAVPPGSIQPRNATDETTGNPTPGTSRQAQKRDTYRRSIGISTSGQTSQRQQGRAARNAPTRRGRRGRPPSLKMHRLALKGFEEATKDFLVKIFKPN